MNYDKLSNNELIQLKKDIQQQIDDLENDNTYKDMNNNLYEGETAITSHSKFKKDKKGIFCESLEEIINDRKKWKNKMLEYERMLDKVEKKILK